MRFNKQSSIIFGAALALFGSCLESSKAELVGDTPIDSDASAFIYPGEIHHGYTVDDISELGRVKLTSGQKVNHLESPLGSVAVFSLASLSKHIGPRSESVIAEAFSRAREIMRTRRFPHQLQDAQYKWQIFIKERGARRSEGALSSERCHAAWMGPPANIFLSPETLASDCGRARKSSVEISEQLESVLVHEIGHVIEFKLMGRGFARRQRWHSEGFASWFEAYSGGDLVESLRKEAIADAKRHFRSDWMPIDFRGTSADYSRSFAMIATIAERSSVSDLLRVYRNMDLEKCRFDEAVQNVLGWDLRRWSLETKSFLESHNLT